MTPLEILSRTSTSIEKHGLARGCAVDRSGAYCLGAALLESARSGNPRLIQKKDEPAYESARTALAGVLGVANSYEGIVKWNDMSYTTKNGELRYRNSEADAIKAIKSATETLFVVQ